MIGGGGGGTTGGLNPGTGGKPVGGEGITGGNIEGGGCGGVGRTGGSTEGGGEGITGGTIAGGGCKGFGTKGGAKGFGNIGGKRKNGFSFIKSLLVLLKVACFGGSIGGRFGNSGRGGSLGSIGSGVNWPGLSMGGIIDESGGSRSGGGNVEGSLSTESFEFLLMFGLWLQMFGCVRGLNVRKPAVKMWVLAFIDFR